MSADMVFWLTFAPMALAALIGLVADAFGLIRFVRGTAGLSAFVGGAVALYGAWALNAQRLGEAFVVGGGFSVSAGLIAVLAAAVVMVGGAGSRIADGQRVALVTIAALGAGLAVQTANLVSLAICLEVTAVCGYALVASARSRRSSEAAMKYFVQGAVATGFMVLGLAVLLGRFASDGSYWGLSQAAQEGGTPLLAGLLMVVVALAFKAASAPFHSWAPDAYESAPAPAAGLLAGPIKLGAVTVLVVIVGVTGTAGAGRDAPLGALGGALFPLLGSLALLSILVGSLLALKQRSYTRMLAYSGVAQVGYALIALAAVSPPVAILYAAVYAVVTVGAFVAAEAFRSLRPEWDGSIAGLSGLGRRDPLVGLAVTVLMLSLAGIPPMAGFWTKFQAFQSAIVLGMGLARQGHGALVAFYLTLVVAGIVGSVVSLAYYGSVLRSLFTENDGGEEPPPLSAPGRLVIVLAVLVMIGGALPLFVPIDLLVKGFLF